MRGAHGDPHSRALGRIGLQRFAIEAAFRHRARAPRASFPPLRTHAATIASEPRGSPNTVAAMTTHIGFLLFPKITQLDLTGPYEALSQLPDASLHLA